MHLLTLSSKRRWYQQRLEDGPGEEAWERERERECERLERLERLERPVESCSEEMSWRSSLISDRSWATAKLAKGGGGGACSSGGWTAGASGIGHRAVTGRAAAGAERTRLRGTHYKTVKLKSKRLEIITV